MDAVRLRLSTDMIISSRDVLQVQTSSICVNALVCLCVHMRVVGCARVYVSGGLVTACVYLCVCPCVCLCVFLVYPLLV